MGGGCWGIDGSGEMVPTRADRAPCVWEVVSAQGSGSGGNEEGWVRGNGSFVDMTPAEALDRPEPSCRSLTPSPLVTASLSDHNVILTPLHHNRGFRINFPCSTAPVYQLRVVIFTPCACLIAGPSGRGLRILGCVHVCVHVHGTVRRANNTQSTVNVRRACKSA